MSGGSLDYLYTKVLDAAAEIERRAYTREQKAFAKHLRKVSAALHDVEWVLSDDYGIGDDTESIVKCIGGSAVIESTLWDAREAVVNLREAIDQYEKK